MCGGKTKTKQSSTSTYTPTAQATSMYNNVFDRANAAADTPYNPAMGRSIADLTPEQFAAFAGVQGNQGSWLPGLTDAGNMVGQAGAAINQDDITRYMNPWQNDVINTTLDDIADRDAMTTRDFMANQVAQGGLGGNGVWLGKATLQGDQAQARNKTIADLRSSGFMQALQAAQADKTRGLTAGQTQAQLAAMRSQLGYSDADALNKIGTQQQTQQQAVNDAATQNAQQETLWGPQMAQWLASIAAGIGPLTGGTTESTGTATQSGGKGIGNIIGAGLSAASMLSDERVKEDVRPIGHTFDGQKIYKFRYKGDPRTQIGLMAQEVEQDHPEAVSERPDGLKMVDYDRATMADGGSVFGGYKTAMPWATINPAAVNPPKPMDINPPAQEKGEDFGALMEMGKKAGSGISDLWNTLNGPTMPSPSSPAGGAMAASGLQGYGSTGGGWLSGLGSLFGFADGGLVPTKEEMDALEMVESGGRDIVNPKSGAFGPRQIMPATATDPGFGVRPLDRSIADPKARLAEQRRFSDDYFKAMLARYDGDRDAARIAYNGGPARADAWLKAGRDDSVIPRESADYYKKIRAVLGDDGANLVAKANTGTRETGEAYKGSSDRATGGLLKRTFGVDFNPLNLTENERRALLVAGLSMMSHGDIGKGGLAGLQYLTGVEAGERDARQAAAKLRYEMQKDAQAQANWTAEQSMKRDQFGQEIDLKKRGADLEGDKFTYQKGEDAAKRTHDITKPTDDLKEYDAYSAQEEAAGRKPLSQLEYMEKLKAAGRSSTNVTVSGEKKGSEEMAKRYAERYFELGKNADGAQQMLDNLDAVEQSLATGVRTGFAGEAEQALRKFGVALGIPQAEVDKVAAGELIQTISNRMALQVRAPGGDAGGMPGAMSDADRTFLKETVPGLLKTPDGNQKLVAIMRAAAQRHQAIYDMAVAYAEEKGQLDPGFDAQVRRYVKEHPLSAAVASDQPTPVKTTTVPGVPKGFSIIEVSP